MIGSVPYKKELMGAALHTRATQFATMVQGGRGVRLTKWRTIGYQL